ITTAYAFTDYRLQGQTMPFALVDIGPPPSSILSLFNLHVALSRSSGRDTIRLLRDFDDKMFTKAHDPELLDPDLSPKLANGGPYRMKMNVGEWIKI
ncbi:hypothetical protein BDZ97DRAFT_1666644, partial [Flammula alnicola]